MGYNTTTWSVDANTTQGSTDTTTQSLRGGVALEKTFSVYEFAATQGYHHPLQHAPMEANSSSKIRIGTTTFGNSADPATSVTGINSATASKEIVTCQWYIKDAITIDQVRFWSVTDEASSANTVNFHIYSYDCDAGNDSDGGDLTGGSLHANGTTETRIGYITNGTLTIDDGDVAAGKSIFCFFENEDGTDDTTIQMTIHYHLT